MERRTWGATFPTLRARRPTPLHLDELRDHCLSLPHVTEGLPFGPDVLVFKVGDPGLERGAKMFALLGLDREPPFVNLKCDPARAVQLRERYADVAPGWHMNKTHWNSVGLKGDVPASLLRELVAHSHAIVFASLPARVQAALGG